MNDDYIYNLIKDEEDTSCQAFVKDGVCPKWRHLSKDCPLRFGKDNFCEIKKGE